MTTTNHSPSPCIVALTTQRGCGQRHTCFDVLASSEHDSTLHAAEHGVWAAGVIDQGRQGVQAHTPEGEAASKASMCYTGGALDRTCMN